MMNKTLGMSARERALLRTIPIIEALTGEARQRMVDMAVCVHYEARNIVFREREPADFFYCVLSGYVRLYRPNKEGKEADIRLCGPGDTFAECLLYDDGGYRYNAQATDAAMLARFDMANVRHLAERHPGINKAIVGTIAAHLLDSMDSLVNDRLQTAPQRVANYLLTACGENGQSASLRLPFRKSLLAGKLGLAPEALSRAFSTLRGAGVTVHGRLIEIQDPDALKSI